MFREFRVGGFAMFHDTTSDESVAPLSSMTSELEGGLRVLTGLTAPRQSERSRGKCATAMRPTNSMFVPRSPLDEISEKHRSRRSRPSICTSVGGRAGSAEQCTSSHEHVDISESGPGARSRRTDAPDPSRHGPVLQSRTWDGISTCKGGSIEVGAAPPARPARTTRSAGRASAQEWDAQKSKSRSNNCPGAGARR